MGDVVVSYTHLDTLQLEEARQAIEQEIGATTSPDDLAELYLHLDAINLELKKRWVARYGWWIVGGFVVVGGGIWWARRCR